MTEALDELERLALRCMPHHWRDKDSGDSIRPPGPQTILALLSDRRADRERIATLLADLRPILETVRVVVSPEGDSWARLSDLLDRLDAALGKETGQ